MKPSRTCLKTGLSKAKGSALIDCPFEDNVNVSALKFTEDFKALTLTLSSSITDNTWSFTITCNERNHEPSTARTSHPVHTRVSVSQDKEIAGLFQSDIKIQEDLNHQARTRLAVGTYKAKASELEEKERYH